MKLENKVDKVDKVVDILLSYEDNLSDGYCYYLYLDKEDSLEIEKRLRIIATEIVDSINDT